jgi:hypothetical protein
MRNFETSTGHVTDEFAKMMVALAAGYATMSGKLSEATIRVYARGLGDLTYEQVQSAMGALLRESTFWPSIADIRRVAVGSVDDAGVLAWAALRRAAGEVGSWASLTVEDGTVVQALDAVGLSWPEFCALVDGPAMHTRRQEFLAAYRAARSKPSGALRLRGACEMSGPLVFARSVTYLLKASGDVSLDRRAIPENV